MVKSELVVLIETQVLPPHVVQMQALFIIESVDLLCRDMCRHTKSIMKVPNQKPVNG